MAAFSDDFAGDDRGNNVCDLAGRVDFRIRNSRTRTVARNLCRYRCPHAVQSFSILQDQSTRWFLLIFTIIVIVATIYAIVFIQQGRRNVPVMYPDEGWAIRMSMPVKALCRLMVNLAGMIPLIFASAIFAVSGNYCKYFTTPGTNPSVKSLCPGGAKTHWAAALARAAGYTGCCISLWWSRSRSFYTSVLLSNRTM